MTEATVTIENEPPPPAPETTAEVQAAAATASAELAAQAAGVAVAMAEAQSAAVMSEAAAIVEEVVRTTEYTAQDVALCLSEISSLRNLVETQTVQIAELAEQVLSIRQSSGGPPTNLPEPEVLPEVQPEAMPQNGAADPLAVEIRVPVPGRRKFRIL